MIATRPDALRSGESARALYVALMFARQLAEWRTVGEYESPMDAARACVSVFFDHWQAIAEQARIMRALAEHPALEEFSGDGIDGPMLASAARALCAAIEAQNDNVARLLDSPAVDDVVRIHGTLYRVNPITEEFEMAPDSEEPATPADRVLLRAIRDAVSIAREKTGQGITRHGFDVALLMLLLMHPADEQPDSLTSTDVADRLFERIMTSAIYRVHQRTGAVVSQQGIDNALRLAAGVCGAIRTKDGIVADEIHDASTPVAGNSTNESARVIPFVRSDDEPSQPANDNGGDDGGDPGE